MIIVGICPQEIKVVVNFHRFSLRWIIGRLINYLYSMGKLISKRKIEKLATCVLINSINLHEDSIILFREGRYSSAYYFSVIAMEEMSKAKALEWYGFYNFSGKGADFELEQKFLLGLYNHRAKQKYFLTHDFVEYSPKYYQSVQDNRLDEKKLRALYVGLKKHKNTIDVHSGISTPHRIKLKDAKQQISVLNTRLLYMIKRAKTDLYFYVDGMDDVLLDAETQRIVKSWKFKSGLKSEKWWYTYWSKKYLPIKKG
jgi:AbiV family abortive infection protein